MERFTRKYHNIKKEYIAYQESEAIDMGLVYSPWRTCPVEQWGLTDDGWVLLHIRDREFAGKSGQVRVKRTFSGGCAMTTSKLEYEKFRIKQKDGRAYIKSEHSLGEVKRTRLKMAILVYVRQLISGSRIDWDAIGRIFRPDHRIPAASIKRIMKRKEVQRMIADELAKALKTEGLTREYQINTIKDAIKLAKENEQPMAMLKGAEMVGDLIKMAEVNNDPTNLPVISMEMMKEIENAGEVYKELQKPERPRIEQIAGIEALGLPGVDDEVQTLPDISSN